MKETKVLNNIKNVLRKDHPEWSEENLDKKTCELFSSHNKKNDEKISIYVTTYRKYNNGNTAGQWVSLISFENSKEFYDYLKMIHSDENEPEFMFLDADIPQYSECMKITDEIIDFYKKLNEEDDENTKEAILKYMYAKGIDDIKIDENTLEHLKEKYTGTYGSETEFVDDIIQEGWLEDKEIDHQTMMNLYDRGWIDEEQIRVQLFLTDYESYDVTNGVAIFANE